MNNFIIAGLLSLVLVGCKSTNTKQLTEQIESKLVDRYVKMNVSVEYYKDTLNIVLLDTFTNFSTLFADLRASYFIKLIDEYIAEYKFVAINQVVSKDTSYLRNHPDGFYKILYTNNDLHINKELYNTNFEFHFCVNYIMNSVPPKEYELVCESHSFNQLFLEGYSGKESFTSLIADFTTSCSNPAFIESLTYKKMLMLAMVSSKNFATTRNNMFNVFFNICNLPHIDPNETPPFQPNAEYEKYIIEKMKSNK